jgi:hypothetical protein
MNQLRRDKASCPEHYPAAEKIPCMGHVQAPAPAILSKDCQCLTMPPRLPTALLACTSGTQPAKSPKDCLVPDASQALTTTTPAGQDGWEGEWQGKLLSGKAEVGQANSASSMAGTVLSNGEIEGR